MKRTLILAGAAFAVAAAAGAVLSRLPDGAEAAAGAGAASRGVEPESIAKGEALFRACSACHTIGRQGADVDGPNLYGVVGARVAGRRPRYGYTQALRDVGGIWTERRLDAWLTDPAAFAPGTAMHFAGLPEARDRADVVAYLATQGPSRK